MAAPDELKQRLQALWQKFHPEMISRLETIAEAINALDNGRLPDTIRLRAVHAAHKLAGSLGTFGLQDGSTAAQQIERLLSESATTSDIAAEIARNFDLLKSKIESK